MATMRDLRLNSPLQKNVKQGYGKHHEELRYSGEVTRNSGEKYTLQGASNTGTGLFSAGFLKHCVCMASSSFMVRRIHVKKPYRGGVGFLLRMLWDYTNRGHLHHELATHKELADVRGTLLRHLKGLLTRFLHLLPQPRLRIPQYHRGE